MKHKWRASLTFVVGLLSVAGALPIASMASPLDQAVQNGKQLLMTATFAGNGRHCTSCHKAGGTTMGELPNGKAIPSLTNAAAIFPRYNKKRGAVLTLQNQVHNCVLGALHGTPPAYGSKEMVELISYLTSLSEGKAINMGGKPQ
ncbi:MAG: c-type cytochrome [Mariprofundales bacterium]|nr:c-type cytochrome [Mariprofundales bacterium]